MESKYTLANLAIKDLQLFMRGQPEEVIEHIKSEIQAIEQLIDDSRKLQTLKEILK